MPSIMPLVRFISNLFQAFFQTLFQLVSVDEDQNRVTQPRADQTQPPASNYEQEHNQRLISLVYGVSLFMLIATFIYEWMTSGSMLTYNTYAIMLMAVVQLAGYGLLRRDSVIWSQSLFCFSLAVGLVWLAYASGEGVHSAAYAIYYVVILAGSIIARNFILTYTLILFGFLAGFGMVYLEMQGIIPVTAAGGDPRWRWFVISIGFVGTGIGTILSTRRWIQMLWELENSEQQLIFANRKLKEIAGEMAQKNTYLNLLQETAESLMNRLDVAELLDEIMLDAAKLCNTRHGYIYLVQDTNQETGIEVGDDEVGEDEVGDDEVGDDEPAEVAPETIELTVGMGYFANHIGMPMKHGEGIGGYVWDTGETVILDDYNRWENRTTRYANHAAFQAAIGVPIYSGATVTGVIGLVYDEKGRTFTKNEIDLMTRFSHLASIALDNARLYAASQQEIAERLRFEEALVHERSLLAERVEERTADLQAANIKLARSARLKDEFLASMSHELRTPLNAILGLSESLGEQIYGNLNDQQMHSLKIIERSGQHLLTLINDVLDVAKIEAGELHFELAMTDIEATVQSSIVMVTQEAERKQLDLSVDLDESLNKIEADPRRLKQILVNLLSNAVKFTPDNGSIGLEAHRVEDEDDPTIQLVEFSVWDTGIGIAKPDMPKLFQPFQQIDSSLSRQYNGTGLGLALVKRLTEMHHGEVSLLSTVGQGSRFIVTIPERQPRRRR